MPGPPQHARQQASKQANKQAGRQGRQAGRQARQGRQASTTQRTCPPSRMQPEAQAHATAFRVFSDGKGASEICSAAEQRARGDKAKGVDTTTSLSLTTARLACGECGGSERRAFS